MNKKEIAKEFTRQMLDQNTPSINFEQVTNMLKQIEQTHREVLNDMESFRTKHRTLSFSFTDHHSQLKLSEQYLPRLTEKLSEQLKNNSSASNEPDMVDRELKEEQQRKRRRGLRR